MPCFDVLSGRFMAIKKPIRGCGCRTEEGFIGGIYLFSFGKTSVLLCNT